MSEGPFGTQPATPRVLGLAEVLRGALRSEPSTLTRYACSERW